jgi:hypothetical protein
MLYVAAISHAVGQGAAGVSAEFGYWKSIWKRFWRLSDREPSTPLGSEARFGYGTEALRLALIEARAIGLPEVFIGSDFDNTGSIKIIECNGGQLAGRSSASITASPHCTTGWRYERLATYLGDPRRALDAANRHHSVE